MHSVSSVLPARIAQPARRHRSPSGGDGAIEAPAGRQGGAACFARRCGRGDGHAVSDEGDTRARGRRSQRAQPLPNASHDRREVLASGKGAGAVASEPGREDRLALRAPFRRLGVGEGAHVHLGESIDDAKRDARRRSDDLRRLARAAQRRAADLIDPELGAGRLSAPRSVSGGSSLRRSPRFTFPALSPWRTS
jgi:hypothetical protein